MSFLISLSTVLPLLTILGCRDFVETESRPRVIILIRVALNPFHVWGGQKIF